MIYRVLSAENFLCCQRLLMKYKSINEKLSVKSSDFVLIISISELTVDPTYIINCIPAFSIKSNSDKLRITHSSKRKRLAL